LPHRKTYIIIYGGYPAFLSKGGAAEGSDKCGTTEAIEGLAEEGGLYAKIPN
jgi:hypothetical protein